MKIFLSWSGPRSRAVAEALNDWLRRVIQAVKPFYSPEIEKGAKWSGEIDSALEDTRFGIVCLTPDNLTSPWIHFEAGALSKTKDALIWTFLHGLTPGDVPPPLGKFQHTVAGRDDTLLLLKTINRRLGEVGGEPLTDKLLEENFETFWPQLEVKLSAAQEVADSGLPKSKGSGEAQRDERAILNEILELARNHERRLKDFDERLYSSRRIGSSSESAAVERDIEAVSLDVSSDLSNPKEVAMRFADALRNQFSFESGDRVTVLQTPRGFVVNVRLSVALDESVVRGLVITAVAALGQRVWGFHHSDRKLFAHLAEELSQEV